jgi:pimeloyl-ACP methyl ester carboxylesterase
MSFPIAQVANVTTVDGVNVFYRHAGSEDNPVIVLLHGFPTSSHMFRNLIPLLAASFFVIAPDLPGFGFTSLPETYVHTFDNMGRTISGFLDALEISRFAMYVFDYGAPAGMRVALERPQSVAAIITQNGNAYEEGFVPESWATIFKLWETGAQEDRDALRGDLTFAITKLQYTEGSPNPQLIQPEAFFLDQALLDRSGSTEIQLDLFFDYRKNVELYPRFQEYFRSSGVPILAVWGANDIFFLPAGATAYGRDARVFEQHLLNASHFALETNEVMVANLMQDFLARNVVF